MDELLFLLITRESILDSVDCGDKPRVAQVHNSLTVDGLSSPVHPKANNNVKTTVSGRQIVKKDLNVRVGEAISKL